MKHSEQMVKKVWEYCKAHQMLSPGDQVLLGVSGGADSVCLLFLLHELKECLDLSLRVVHVHHGIREEADEDAAFVKELCKALKVPFAQVKVDVPRLARKEGLSEEEAGRKARYESFEAQAKKWQEETGRDVKIALAHHAGDRAETMLFHLFRGTGLKGLASIPPVRKTQTEGVSVVRPLLCLTRLEIEEWLREEDHSYRDDHTNFEDAYARNRIRHHILPYAESEICTGATQHMCQAADLLSEAEEFLAAETARSAGDCVAFIQEGYEIEVQYFTALHPLLQKRILIELLRQLSPHAKDMGSIHVESVRDLFLKNVSGRSVDLPFGICAAREYDKVFLRRQEAAQADAEGEDGASEALIEGLGEDPILVSHAGKMFEFQLLGYKKTQEIPQKTYTKWFDYDKIKGTISIRTRRPGDYLMIRTDEGRAARKSIKEYFITEKVPKGERESLPLLVCGQHVLWIPGHRISEAFKVDDKTKTVLQVRLFI